MNIQFRQKSKVQHYISATTIFLLLSSKPALIAYITRENLHNTNYLYNKCTRGRPTYNLGADGGEQDLTCKINPMNKISFS